MPIFDEFPEGDDFWLIKDIDRFCLPHALSESAAVDVLLQRMPPSIGRRASRATPDEIIELFGVAMPEDYWTARVHVGSLPLLRVGHVYQNREYRSQLPGRVISFYLPEAERSARAHRLGDLLKPPPGWHEKMPYRPLVSAEYHIGQTWQSQQLLVIDGPDEQDVILPRMAIFQRFYGPHSEMADALTSGPWDKVYKRLVCETEFESGLRTQVASDGEWQLVLDTRIPDEFRWLIALFHFDEYARKQVNALYAQAVVQREANKPNMQWFCTATLPFNPEYCMELRVKGYDLSPTRARPKGAFLVTSIVAASAPQYPPRLAYGRANSGETAEDVTPVDEPPPFGGSRSGNRRNSGGKRITSTHAPDPKTPESILEGDTFEWLGPLDERRQIKDSSKRYTGSPPPLPELQSGPGSTAKPVGGGQASEKVRANSGVREKVSQFEDLLTCIEVLTQRNVIGPHCVIQPRDSGLPGERGGRVVWNLYGDQFQPEGQRGRWHLMSPGKNEGAGPYERAVLVVEFTYKAHEVLVFEVECRSSESFLMAALAYPRGVDRDHSAICKAMLKKIVAAKGRHLDIAAANVANGFPLMKGHAFKHQYSPGDKKCLDPDAFERFLAAWCEDNKKRGRKKAK